MKAAVQEPPGASGIDLANWYWRTVRQFAGDRFSIGLSRSSCVNWLHRLGSTFKRPKKRLLKADAAKREAFVARVRHPEGGGPADRSQDILCR